MCPKVIQPSVDKESIVKDYGEILKQYHLTYQPVDYYYQVDQPEKVQGWILHLSSIWTQTYDLLTTILPLLAAHNVPFKVVKNKEKALMLCDGSLGYYQLGKVFCIYPENDEIAVDLVKKLLDITKEFKGCAIPTDFHLGGIIYTRYGSFSPKLYPDQTGYIERYIYDIKGQLIKDEYNTPFKFPKGVQWPFKDILAPVEEIPTTFLNNSYKVLATIKTDAKGRVMKALRLNSFKIQWIIIKEAKHGVFVDKKGRDIRDRLLWQYDLQNDLYGKVPVPKTHEFFREKDNSYLVMEYIKGKDLGWVIEDVYELSVWFNLDTDKKSLLVDYLLQLIDTIGTLHQQGYVHRDINWVNFILDRQKRLVTIDLELAYSIGKNIPEPPFTFGTPGFMSPEQIAVKPPRPNQDIYSLGALMIKFFTNLSPFKFECSHSGLPNCLNFFVQNMEVSNVIANCLRLEPTERPYLKTIRSILENFHARLNHPRQSQLVDNVFISHVLNCLIYTLGDAMMVHGDHVWHSNAVRDDEPLDNPQVGVAYKVGLYTGVNGVMYVLALVKSRGYEVQPTAETYLRSLEYLRTNFLNILPNVVPGLYYGAAGVAISIAKGIEAGLIDPKYKSSIEKCLEVPAIALSIAHGVAGQGLAVLNCLKFLTSETTDSILHHCASVLLENQQKDGSWLTISSESNRPIKYTGFSQGVAGICFFLLKYYNHYKDDRVKSALVKALRWLKRKSLKNKEGTYWLTNNRKRIFDRWLKDGVAGVALCFITAYKVLGDQAYKEIAENALRINPEYLVHPNFSLANGMAGLGEVYLTAAEVFENDEWQTRAEFILNVLMHAHRGDDEQSCYWIVEDNKIPTADFMVGNSGILHFLVRYLSPKASSFF